MSEILNYQISQAASGNIDYERELNAEQFQAVTAPAGPILVIAGAGSGKTRTLTYRVNYLLEKGVSLERILLLTFTNKAAREMLERVHQNTSQALGRLWGGTFHHIGNRLLRLHGEKLGYTTRFTILDSSDSEALVRACYADIGLNPKDKLLPKPGVVHEVLSYAASRQQNIDRALNTAFGHLKPFHDQIARLEKAYKLKKKDCDAVDYDDLLLLPLRILKEDAALLEYYQERFEYILVDEYQDTNHIQAEITDLLASRHKSIMVVGDDAQSIYSWRGADFQNIITFPERYPGTQIIRLEMNYRSRPEILALANQTIAQNTRQFPKNLRAARMGGVKPAFITLEDSRQQATFIGNRITKLIEEGVPLNQIAVLYRAHFHSMEIQMELTRRKIPFSITSGLRFFEQAHVKDAAAFLRFLINPKDEMSFKRAVLLLPAVGEKGAGKIWDHFLAGQSWEEIPVPAKARNEWLEWGELNRRIAADGVDYHPSEILRAIIEPFYQNILKTTYDNYNARLDDLQQLMAYAQGFEETHEFLSQLALMTNAETEASGRRVSSEAVQLGTIHQAKGLEYQAVFLIMLCDGMFPSSKAVETSEGEEEERRLFYVGITRAKDELYLTYPKRRALAGQGDIYQMPSRFLSDFSKDLCTIWKIDAVSSFSSMGSSMNKPSFGSSFSGGFNKTTKSGAEVEPFRRSSSSFGLKGTFKKPSRPFGEIDHSSERDYADPPFPEDPF